MIKKNLLLVLIMTGCLLVVIFSALALLNTSKNQVEKEKPEEVSPKEQTKSDLAKIMPVSTDKFIINYLPKDELFLITIIQVPFDQSKKEAQDWLKTHGVEDLCALNISWWATKGAKEPSELTANERTTESCPLKSQT